MCYIGCHNERPDGSCKLNTKHCPREGELDADDSERVAEIEKSYRAKLEEEYFQAFERAVEREVEGE